MNVVNKWLGSTCTIFCIVWGAGSASADTAASPGVQFGTISVGGGLGLNIATFGGDDADGEIVTHTNKIGFAAEALAGLHLHRYVAVTSGFVYSDQGARGAVNGDDQGSLDFAYLHIPVLLQARAPLKGRIVPYAVFGPALGILLSAVVHTNLGNTDDIKDELPSLDVGLIGGLGASLDISSSGAMTLEARYTMGLRSLYADKDEDIKNRVWTFSLGYQHRFGR